MIKNCTYFYLKQNPLGVRNILLIEFYQWEYLYTLASLVHASLYKKLDTAESNHVYKKSFPGKASGRIIFKSQASGAMSSACFRIFFGIIRSMNFLMFPMTFALSSSAIMCDA